jgi:hypothetical protein
MRIFQPTVTGSNTTTGSLHISGPVYFYTLETSSTFHVLTYNTSSGQVFFTGSDSFGGKPDDPYDSIQFNYSGALSGSSNLLFINNVIYLTGSMLISGAISASFGPNTVGFYGTASWAQSSSFITGSGVYGPFGSNSVLSASYASSSTLADTASFILNPYPIDVTGSSLYSVDPVSGIPSDMTTSPNSIWFGSNAGSNLGVSAIGTIFLGQNAGLNTDTSDFSIFIGGGAGANTVNNAYYSIFIGGGAGAGSTEVYSSNFIGGGAGNSIITNAFESNFIGVDAGALTNMTYHSNFLGYQAGYAALNAFQTNFIGYKAGYSASGASTANFMGYYAGYQATNTNGSNFIGNYAGYQATNANNSNFLGYEAGYSASSADNSSFIGNQAGFYATNAEFSQFIGNQAGSYAPNANNSNFIGKGAGFSASNADNASFIGTNAGYYATNTQYSQFIGTEAGYSASTANRSNFIGAKAGYKAANANNSNFLGFSAGNGATRAIGSNFLGGSAGAEAANAINSNFLGFGAGVSASNASSSNFLGPTAGYQAINASYSTLIGYQAGFASSSTVSVGPNNIIIGTNITLDSNRRDAINIGGIIFGSGSYSDITSEFPFSGSAGGNIGINIPHPTYNLHASGTVAFPSLTTSSQNNVVMIDTSSGQLFYTSSNAIGGGNARPGGPNLSVQFNSASVFSGSSTIYINNDGPSSVEYDHLHLDNAWLTVRDSSNNNIILLTTDGLQLGDYGGYASLDWSSRILYDSVGSQSIHYNDRQLSYQNYPPSPAIDWGTVNQITISGSTFLKGLPESSSNYILTYNTSSNQVYFASSTTITTLPFPFSGSAIITGSLLVSGSGITGSLFGTSSWAINAITSSYPISVTGSSLYSVAPPAGIPSISDSIFFGTDAGITATSASDSNFLGYRAGRLATNASQSNFLGSQAGDGATNAGNSNFLGRQAGYQATYATHSNFFGYQAGYQVYSASNSNFLGRQAGYQATYATHSNFFGFQAGNAAPYANNSNFLGYEAGELSTSASYSNFLGNQAGRNADFADNSNFMGNGAGEDAAYADNSNFIGQNAGRSATYANNSNFIGQQAGTSTPYADNSNFIGRLAGNGAISASNSTFIGPRTGVLAIQASHSFFVGYEAGQQAYSASYSTLIGYRAGQDVTSGINSISSNNIIIGNNISLPGQTKDSINIGGLIFATGSNSNFISNPIKTPAGGNVGINIYPPLFNFHASGTIAFPSLTNSSYTHVVVIDTGSGQLFFTSSIGGGSSFNYNSTSSIIGDGIIATWDINHGFNTRNLHVTVYESGSNGETVYPDIRRPDNNTVRVVFANPPSSSQYIVYISQ